MKRIVVKDGWTWLFFDNGESVSYAVKENLIVVEHKNEISKFTTDEFASFLGTVVSLEAGWTNAGNEGTIGWSNRDGKIMPVTREEVYAVKMKELVDWCKKNETNIIDGVALCQNDEGSGLSKEAYSKAKENLVAGDL